MKSDLDMLLDQPVVSVTTFNINFKEMRFGHVIRPACGHCYNISMTSFIIVYTCIKIPTNVKIPSITLN